MSAFSSKRALAIARKEIFHVLRDPFTIALAVLLPVLIVGIFGTAIEFNVKDIGISVYDGDGTQASRALVETFASSGHFKVRHQPRTVELVTDLDSERAKAVLVIEPGFEADLQGGRGANAQVILDGADNSTVGVISGYLSGIRAAAIRKLVGESPVEPVVLKPRFLFNPELRSDWFVVPGLGAAVLAVLSVLLTALTVAREWENGSMELLLSTPVRPFEIIVGKLAPYSVLGMAAVLFVYVVARLGFGVPFRGSFLLYMAGSLLFLIAYLAQGLLISVILRRQQLAMQVAIISGLLPSLLLSGFIFPVESMPKFFQVLTSILPAKWFMIISRDLFLKGSGLRDLLLPFGALTAFTVFMVSMATARFKKDLEP